VIFRVVDNSILIEPQSNGCQWDEDLTFYKMLENIDYFIEFL